MGDTCCIYHSSGGDPHMACGGDRARWVAFRDDPLPPVEAPARIADGSSPAGVYGAHKIPSPAAYFSPRELGRITVEADPLDDVRACAREALTVIGRARILSGSMAQGDREELTRALDAFDLARNRSRAGLAPRIDPKEGHRNG